MAGVSLLARDAVRLLADMTPATRAPSAVLTMTGAPDAPGLTGQAIWMRPPFASFQT